MDKNEKNQSTENLTGNAGENGGTAGNTSGNAAEDTGGNTAGETRPAGGGDGGTAGNAGGEAGTARTEKPGKKAGKRTGPAVRPGEELVPIRLFKDGDKYKDDVFVAVNGERIQIRRGERVLVKRKFADVLEQSMQQDMATASLIDRESSQYEEEAKARGL